MVLWVGHVQRSPLRGINSGARMGSFTPGGRLLALHAPAFPLVVPGELHSCRSSSGAASWEDAAFRVSQTQGRSRRLLRFVCSHLFRDPGSRARPLHGRGFGALRDEIVRPFICPSPGTQHAPGGALQCPGCVGAPPGTGALLRLSIQCCRGLRRERDIMTSVMQVFRPVRLLKTFKGPVGCCVSFWASKEDLRPGPCLQAASSQR